MTREEAIMAVKEVTEMSLPLNNRHYESLQMAIKALEEPERKTGHWIKTARWGRVYYCDQCRNYLDFDGVNAGRGSTNYCPNCGADMRGEEECC